MRVSFFHLVKLKRQERTLHFSWDLLGVVYNITIVPQTMAIEMSWANFLIVVLAVLGCSLTSVTARSKRDAASSLFTTGKEYKYQYETLVTAGSEEPVSYASSYRLKGTLRVQGTAPDTINVKLEDVQIGLYNGPWSYFPVPNFEYFSSEDLNSMSEPFQIITENGKFKTLVMNDQEPEWASNIKRGFATYLQMDLTQVSAEKLQIFKSSEVTTMGECTTAFEVLPVSTTKTGLGRISKFRNHADCPDAPTRTSFITDSHYPCKESQTRDIVNSTAYATYDINVAGNQITVQRLTILSSILYWPFTTNGPFQYSWLNMTLALTSVSAIGDPITGPENPETHEDLTYVFEQSDFTDPDEETPDLRLAEPLLFHHTTIESDPESQEKIMELCHKRIEDIAGSLSTADVLKDTQKFHKLSPFAILPIISSLDYDSLKSCYSKYSEAASTSANKLLEFQLFLDGLLLSGTSATSLMVRDILLQSEDNKVILRLANTFPHYIRHPSELLAKELDPIISLASKDSLSKTTKRMIEFSMATLISRSCRKSLCVTTGLLEKYIDYFEKKLLGTDHFEEQTVAILGLKNLGKGRALDKVLEIAAGKTNHDRTVRVQSIWALGSLVFDNATRVFDALLPVFYNRAESCEIRTSVFGLLMSTKPDERTLLEIVYFMWTETCPQTSNIVRSTLTSMADSKLPCNPMRAAARTVLKYLPPGIIDPTRTTSYAIDYYDKKYGFGHATYSTVQKSGHSALPVSVYIGLSNYVGGYLTHNLGLFIRLQGFGKAVIKKLTDMRQGSIEEVQKLLASIKVEERTSYPLKLELTLMLNSRAILHYSADEKSFFSVSGAIRVLQGISKDVKLIWERSALIGGITYQQPLEIGTPVSIFAAAAALGSIDHKIPNSRATNIEMESRLQFNLFGITSIANHVPSIGTVHGVTAYRTLRMRLPSHFKLNLDTKKFELNFVNYPPKQSDPATIIFHATTETSVLGDTPNQIRDSEASAKLRDSCPSCSAVATVSRGKTFRKSRELPFKLPAAIKGIDNGVKYFDCERDHSRSAVLKKLRKFISDDEKNAGFFNNPVAKAILAVQHARQFLFLSPYAETCGLSLRLSQDESAQTKLTKIEGSLKVSKSANKMSLQSKLQLKNTGAEPSVIKLELLGNLEEADMNSQEIKLKLSVNDPAGKNHGVACINASNYIKRLTKDLFCVIGENEPSVKERIDIKMGKIAPGDSNANLDINSIPCLDNHANILIVAEARRSPEQVQESKDATLSPYKDCKAQKNTEAYPGTFVPPTKQCIIAMVEQTSLRSANVTVNYKVSQDAQKRWRQPALLLGSLLAPYLIDATEATEHKHNPNHHHHASTDSGNYEGEVEMDLNIRKDSPTVDIHYTGSSGVEQHFHGIDASLLPEPFTLRPSPGRISQLILLGFQTGVLGQCSVTQNTVLTFDDFTYSTKLTDCFTLISADCGSNPQYAVLAKKIADSKLAVTIYLGEQRIVLEGASDPVVDGKTLQLPDKKVVEENEQNSFKALRNGEEIYVVSVAQGVYIRYTGYFVSVTLGSRYRGVHCGLCGSWDSSIYNDLQGPEKCAKPLTPDDMAKVYIVREGNCARVAKDCTK